MSAIGFLAVCILGCDALLYFLFQRTYGEKHRGLARKRKSNVAAGNAQHSQPTEYVSARSPHLPAGPRQKRAGTGRENENVIPIRRTARLAGRTIAASLSDAKQ